jgi:hypothetical protein
MCLGCCAGCNYPGMFRVWWGESLGDEILVGGLREVRLALFLRGFPQLGERSGARIGVADVGEGTAVADPEHPAVEEVFSGFRGCLGQ